MDYTRLRNQLEKYGRDNGYAYVCDSYRRDLLQDKKYLQWRRVKNIAILRAMTPEERKVLDAMLGIRVEHAKVAARPVRIYEGMNQTTTSK